MTRSNQRRSIAKFNYNKELLQAAIQRYTSQQKLLKTSLFPSKAEDTWPATTLKMKSTTAFFKDLDTKFGTVNNSTDICIIALEQNTFYSMAASVVEIYIQENQQKENLHLQAASPELIWRMMFSKSRQNSWKMHAKEPTLLQSCRLEACPVLKLKPVTVTLQGFCQDPE